MRDRVGGMNGLMVSWSLWGVESDQKKLETMEVHFPTAPEAESTVKVCLAGRTLQGKFLLGFIPGLAGAP